MLCKIFMHVRKPRETSRVSIANRRKKDWWSPWRPSIGSPCFQNKTRTRGKSTTDEGKRKKNSNFLVLKQTHVHNSIGRFDGTLSVSIWWINAHWYRHQGHSRQTFRPLESWETSSQLGAWCPPNVHFIISNRTIPRNIPRASKRSRLHRAVVKNSHWRGLTATVLGSQFVSEFLELKHELFAIAQKTNMGEHSNPRTFFS